jgi:hypothetical protein
MFSLHSNALIYFRSKQRAIASNNSSNVQVENIADEESRSEKKKRARRKKKKIVRFEIKY